MPVTESFSKAAALAFCSSVPLLVIDHLLVLVFPLRAIFRITILLAMFTISFLTVSRFLSIFRPDDFAILETAVPRFLRSYLKIVEHLLVHTGRPISQVTV